MNDSHKQNTITRYRALLIGVRDYEDPRFNPVKYAVEDAQAMAKELQTHGYEWVTLLHSDLEPDHQPSLNNILTGLTHLQADAGANTLLLVYFAGHGLTHQGQAYLLPSQRIVGDDYERLALGVAELQDQLLNSGARGAVLVLDACHAGAMLGARAASPDFVRQTIEQAAGLALLSATDQDSLAYEDDELKHGIFTYYLLQALQGQITTAPHPYLTVSRAYEHVNNQLLLWSQQHPDQAQRPTWQQGVYGDLPLLKLPPTSITTPESAVNPFIAGPAIRDPQHFYGRQAELQQIAGRVGGVSAQSISIVGQRRMGKSSLLWQVKTQAETLFKTGHRYEVLYLDMSSTASSSNKALMRTLRRELGRANLPTWDAAEDGDLAALTYTLQDLEQAFAGVRLVLCLDEFEWINDRPAEFDGLLETLRSEAQLGRLALVTASRTPLADLCAQGRLNVSPFFNIFTQVRLTALEEAAWRQLVTDGLGHLDPEAWTFVETCAEGHPFLTQLAATMLWQARQAGPVDYAALETHFATQAAPYRAYDTRHPAGED